MSQISQAQKNIIIATGVIIILFLAIGIFMYMPAVKKIINLKKEFDSTKAQIDEIESMVGKSGSANKEMEKLYKEYQRINSRFPEKEERVLGLISELAQKASIEITGMKSRPKFTWLDRDQQEIEIDGKVCRCLTVTVQIKARYGEIVDYFELLKESLPAYTTVDKLTLARDVYGEKTLSATADISIYLLL